MPTHSHGTVEVTGSTFTAAGGSTFHGVTNGADVTGDAGSGAAYWPRWYAANWIIKAA